MGAAEDTDRGDHGPDCTCGHPRTAHEHHRAGSDCSRCTCSRFRHPGGPLGALAHRVAQRLRTASDR